MACATKVPHANVPRMALNADWHDAHPMPDDAGFDQRVDWHADHAEACGCREPPADIAEAIAERQDEASAP